MRSKKYQKVKSKIDKNKLYTVDEAIDFIKENKIAKFDESIELHIKLGIDPNKTEQQVKGTLILPYGTVKKKKIAAFVSQKNIETAKKAGAEVVGGQELIEKIKKTGKCDFDVAIAEPEMMKDLAKIAKILGPKGLMPNPKSQTITTDVKKTIEELNKGKIVFKNDETGNIHQAVAKVSWPKEKIKENILKFLESVKKAKPAKVKSNFIKGVYLATTMGPSLKISI
ncbi:50S ribosomal protein L1 [bacterium]|nr:50S ribosomal protein L1 [bacterium]